MVTIKRRQASIKRFHPVRLGVVTAAMLTIAGCGDGPQPNASPADTSDGTSTTTQSPPVEEQSQLVAMPDQTNALNIETPKFSTEVTVDRVVCYGSEGNLTALHAAEEDYTLIADLKPTDIHIGAPEYGDGWYGGKHDDTPYNQESVTFGDDSVTLDSTRVGENSDNPATISGKLECKKWTDGDPNF